MFPSAKKIRNHQGILNQYDCGCMIVRDSAGAHTIHACPMHNAAPELLEALSYVATSFWTYLHDRGMIIGADEHPEGGYWDSIRAANVALAKAKAETA